MGGITGFSLRHTAKLLGYSPATLCKELKRNRIHGQYEASRAHQLAVNRRKRVAYRKKKLPEKLETYVFEKMRLYWSPEQISGRLLLDFPDDKTMRISFKTIYRRIARGVKKQTPWAELYHFLRLKRPGKCIRGHMKVNPGPAGRLPSIESRPSIVDEKRRFGDWESDLVNGKVGKGNIATFVERSTGILLAAECPTRSPSDYNIVALKLLGNLPSQAVRTITVDRGSEFFGYRELEKKLNLSYYFCHPRCPNERGLNEQVNGLLRQFFPKGRALRGITNELNRAVTLLNHRPRKRLGYKTPVEMLNVFGLNEVLTLGMTI